MYKCDAFSTAVGVIIVCLISAFAQAAGDEGLVAHFTFDEGAGDTTAAADGLPGRIFGARFVSSGDGYALRLDGKDDYVDFGSPKALDLRDAITVEGWLRPEAVSPGEPGVIGKAYDSYVLTYYADGKCWWYIGGGGNNVRATVPTGHWHHVVGTFDGSTLRLYVDGKLAASKKSSTSQIPGGGKFFIGKSSGDSVYTRNAHFQGMVDEVRIYNRPLSPEEVLEHYRTTNITHEIGITASVDYGRREVVVGLDLRGLGKLPPRASARVELRKTSGTKPLQSVLVRPIASWGKAEVSLPVGELVPGQYQVRATALGAGGKTIGRMSSVNVTVLQKPSWPDNPPGVKVLNNFVSELLRVEGPFEGAHAEFEFTNPRYGWVFVSSTADVRGDGKLRVLLETDRREQVIVHEHGAPETLEAMRLLPKGRWRLHVTRRGDATLGSLSVRSIPELFYCQFQANPHVTEYGPYDWEFLSKYVLPHCSAIVGSGAEAHRPYVRQWTRQGRKWIGYCGLPGLRENKPVDTDEVEAAWSANAGYSNSLYGGIIVDEFSGGEYPQYPGWTEALRRINANPRFKGKAFYAWCGPLYGGCLSAEFSRTVMDGGGFLVLERYLQEQPTEAGAMEYIRDALRDPVVAWEKAQPGVLGHMVMCLGYLCQPPESLNVNPSVDYKAFMDMQFNMLANDPAFFGLWGVMEYLSSYADEEAVRWAGKLYRHYCIEGKTDPLCKDPYILTHIENPDFAAGLDGWTARPAEPGSITTGSMDGYSWLQGRYPKTSMGDTFALMRRSAKGPNVLSQRIKNLQPGRLYSLKMFTGDHQDLSVKQKHAVSIELGGVELLPEKCFTHVFPNCYAHHWGPFDAEHNAWMNFHWRVFRAKGPEGTISISDWAKPDAPGGPVGQELMFNFVEVQPYLED